MSKIDRELIEVFNAGRGDLAKEDKVDPIVTIQDALVDIRKQANMTEDEYLRMADEIMYKLGIHIGTAMRRQREDN